MPGTREKNIFHHYLFRNKIIQNCLKIDAPYQYDNYLLLRQQTQQIWLVLEADTIKISKTTTLIWCLAQRMHFLQDVFQVTTIVLFSVSKVKLAAVVEGDPKTPFFDTY